MKRIYSLITVLIILILSTLLISLGAFAESGESGECTWSMDGDTLTVSGSGAMSDRPIIDEQNTDIKKIIFEDGVTSVSGIALYAFTEVSEIYLSSSICEIDAEFFSTFGNLSTIALDPENQSFCLLDGVLYSKDMTTLIKYPCTKENDLFVIPDGVTAIGYKAFCGAYMLYGVDIPTSVNYIGDSAFFGTPIYTDKENWDVDGSLYIGDCLISASDYDGTAYEVKEGTRVAASGAFAFIDHPLDSVFFSEGVEHIGDNCFGALSVKELSIPRSIKSFGNYMFFSGVAPERIYFRSKNISNIDFGKGNDALMPVIYMNACLMSSEHAYGAFEITQEPTCTEKGEKQRVCSLCDDVVVHSIDAYGHACALWHTTVPSTCFSFGEETTTCRVCSAEVKRQLPLSEHSYGEWITALLPSCRTDGYQTRICQVCKHEDKLELEKIEHTFGEYTTVLTPTEDKEGLAESKCVMCGTVKAVPLDKLLPLDSQKDTQAPTKTENIIVIVSTVIVCASLAVAVAIAVVTVIIIRKKKQRR